MLTVNFYWLPLSAPSRLCDKFGAELSFKIALFSRFIFELNKRQRNWLKHCGMSNSDEQPWRKISIIEEIDELLIISRGFLSFRLKFTNKNFKTMCL